MSVISSNSTTYAQFTVDNIQIDGNTISSTDTNGDINLSPDGTGTVVINTDIDFDNININGNTISSTSGGMVLQPLSGQVLSIDQDGNVVSLDIDTEATTADAINIQANTLTTGNAIDVAGAAAVTTGSVLIAAVTGTTRTDGELLDISHVGNSVAANAGGIAKFLSNDSDTGARNVLEVVNEHASATGAVNAAFRQDSTGNNIFVNQDGNGIGINIDSEATTAATIAVDADAMTTGDAVTVTADALTTGSYLTATCASTARTGGALIDVSATGDSAGANTGGIMLLTQDDADTGARSVLSVVQEHASATGAIGVSVEQDSTAEAVFVNCDGNAIGVNIDSEATTAALIAADADQMTTGDAITITADALTTGSYLTATCTSTATTGGALIDVSKVGNSAAPSTQDVALLTMNDSDTGARSVLSVIQEHASATGAAGITVRQDSTANGVFINQDGVGVALSIDTESTTADGILVQADAITTGVCARLASNSADVTARNLVEVVNDNTAAVGVTPLNIQQDAVVQTNFKIVADFAGFTLFVSDGTNAETNLTGVAGDICINGGTGGGQMAYCDSNGTNWTNM